MDCLAGASTGALKSISLRDNSFLNVHDISVLQPRQDEITAISFTGEDETEVLVGQMNGKLKLYDTIDSKYTTLFEANAGEQAIRGLGVLDGERIMTARQSGVIAVWDKRGEKLTSYSGGTDVRFAQSAANRVLCGGRNNSLRILDAETGAEQWVAKNVRNDELDLAVPIWFSDARFLPNSKGRDLIVAGTGVHSVRLYDVRAQRRPVLDIPFEKLPIRAIALRPNQSSQVLVANTEGSLALIDMRAKRTTVCKYPGSAGAIRSISVHPTADAVLSAGADRFVRVHAVESRKLLNKVYCKSALNVVLWKRAAALAGGHFDAAKMEKMEEEDAQSVEDDDDNDDDDDDSGDDAWEGLQEVHDNVAPQTNVRRKAVDVSPPKKRKTQGSAMPPKRRLAVEEVKIEEEADEDANKKRARLERTAKRRIVAVGNEEEQQPPTKKAPKRGKKRLREEGP